MFLCHSYGYNRDLHSFPTRRSSDLGYDRSEWPIMIRWPSMVRRPNSRIRQGLFSIAESRSAPLALRSAIENKRSEEHTSELQSRQYLVCRLLLEKKKAHRSDRQCIL